MGCRRSRQSLGLWTEAAGPCEIGLCTQLPPRLQRRPSLWSALSVIEVAPCAHHMCPGQSFLKHVTDVDTGAQDRGDMYQRGKYLLWVVFFGNRQRPSAVFRLGRWRILGGWGWRQQDLFWDQRWSSSLGGRTCALTIRPCPPTMSN